MPKAQVLKPTPENLRLCADALARGELVAIPTETVYGLAGNALQEQSLAQIFAVKERPTFDPLIVHVAPSTAPALEWLTSCPWIDTSRMDRATLEWTATLIERFWPGPLTLVLPKSRKVPDLVTSGLDSVGLRMPAHPVTQELLKLCEFPLAAPSANRFGRISPTRPEHVVDELGDRISWILDGGACAVGVESTVLLPESQTLARVLRPGGVSVEQLRQALPTQIKIEIGSSTASSKTGLSPGLLDSHYAPRTQVELVPKLELSALASHSTGTLGLLFYQGDPRALISQARAKGLQVIGSEVLSPEGNPLEAAAHLFGALRRLDSGHFSRIIAELPPSLEGLDRAIQDRLTRAAARR